MYLSSAMSRFTGSMAMVLAANCAGPAWAQSTAMHAPSSAATQSPEAAKELAAARLQAHAAAARAHAAGAIDTTPPVLKHIAVSGSVNAQLPNQSISADINITDNLSGLVYFFVEFVSPSGMQSVYRTKQMPSPSTSVNSTYTVGLPTYSTPGFTVFSEPGTWVASFLYGYDAAGNDLSYDQAQLAALGNTTFTVANAGGYDVVPPLLASGTIVTTNLRLSKPPKGTVAGTTPYVSGTLSITDSGNGRVSGAYFGYMSLCLADGLGGCTDTINMNGVTNRSGLVANTMTIGAELRADQTPGSYKINYVELQDIAGNFSILSSSDTDFGDYFPVTTIFVNQ